ncbi:MAG: HNH endonuclease [bacterium]
MATLLINRPHKKSKEKILTPIGSVRLRENGDAELIRRILDYNPETGEFRWKPRAVEMFENGAQTAAQSCAIWNARYAGKVAGCMNNNGYLVVRISRRCYFAHRIAWLIVTGEWPNGDVDHKNLDKSDNRWNNLREATRSQNLANKRTPSSNTSGYKGVHWNRQIGKWQAQIRVKGKGIYLGVFNTIDAASSAYENAALMYFGEFARIA